MAERIGPSLVVVAAGAVLDGGEEGVFVGGESMADGVFGGFGLAFRADWAVGFAALMRACWARLSFSVN